MIDKEKIVNFNQYKDILNILEMKNLILKSNYLYQKLKENKAKDNNIEFFWLIFSIIKGKTVPPKLSKELLIPKARALIQVG